MILKNLPLGNTTNVIHVVSHWLVTVVVELCTALVVHEHVVHVTLTAARMRPTHHQSGVQPNSVIYIYLYLCHISLFTRLILCNQD